MRRLGEIYLMNEHNGKGKRAFAEVSAGILPLK